MKKRVLLFTVIAGFGYVTLSSYITGAAFNVGADGTKATGTTNTCGQVGCHNAGATTSVAIVLDSAGIPVDHYIAGHTYTVKISGSNTSATLNLPKFGFQIAVVKSSGAGTSSAANAGTLASSGLPAGVRHTTPAMSGLPIDIVEQNTQLAAASGTGASGTTYTDSVTWTAPATSGTGSIVLYGCINAVNNDNNNTGDAYNSATPVTITELVVHPTAVSNVTGNISLKAFPNPMVNELNLQINNAQAGTYSLQVFDLNGRNIASENITLGSTSQVATLHTANWAPGMYSVIVEKDGNRQVIPVVKQ